MRPAYLRRDWLLAQAERARRRAVTERSWSRPLGRARAAGHHSLAYIGGLVVLLFIALLPIDVPRPPFLRDRPSDGGDFLRAAWQVSATVVALTTAVVVFALQVLASNPRRGITLRDFAESSRLLRVLESGSIGLVLAGAVLLGWGSGPAEGWATLVSTLVLTGPVLLLPWAFRDTVSALDPSALERLRQQRIRSAVQRQVDHLVLLEAARHELTNWLAQHRVELPLSRLGHPSPGSSFARALRSGYVADLDLPALGRLAAAAGSGRVRLLVELDSQVESGQAVLEYPASLESGMGKRADRIVDVS